MFRLNRPVICLFRQELQRLESSERGVERDLIRINRDLARISVISPLDHSPIPNQTNDLPQIPSTPSLPNINTNSTVQASSKRKFILGRSVSVTTSRTSIAHMMPAHQKRFSLNQASSFHEKPCPIDKQTIPKTKEDRPYLQQHAHIIDQEKQKIEQKLKEFLN